MQELELARRRAEKAAEGKRANAAAARAKRRATRPRTDDRGAAAADAEAEEASHEEEDDLEAKLATTRDEKEAKRLRRCAVARAIHPNDGPGHAFKRCKWVLRTVASDSGDSVTTGCCGTGYLHSRQGRGRRATSAIWKRRPRKTSRWCAPCRVLQQRSQNRGSVNLIRDAGCRWPSCSSR